MAMDEIINFLKENYPRGYSRQELIKILNLTQSLHIKTSIYLYRFVNPKNRTISMFRYHHQEERQLGDERLKRVYSGQVQPLKHQNENSGYV